LKVPLGEAFGAQPKALPIIDQEFERGASAVAKDVDRATQGIVAECLTTDGGEPINAFTKIDGLQREKDAALGGELQH
jgi:hypothetical protein